MWHSHLCSIKKERTELKADLDKVTLINNDERKKLELEEIDNVKVEEIKLEYVDE